MQTDGMLRGTVGAMGKYHVLVIGTLILAYIGENAHALPLQVLPNIPGYIAVYIRHGDQPLDEINPALAEAFHEKQTLENNPPERFGEAADELGTDLENHSSYDEGEEDVESEGSKDGRRKGTIYLIGVRQSSEGESSLGNDNLGPKIALPFEVLERDDAIEANSADDDEGHEKSKDAWIEKLGKQKISRKPIGLSKEAVIKASGLPIDVKDLEKLAAEVEREETRPNDLYDSANAEDHYVSLPRRSFKKISTSEEETKETRGIGGIVETLDDRRLRSIEDPKDYRSMRSRTSERMLRPTGDLEESGSKDESTDFMVQEE